MNRKITLILIAALAAGLGLALSAALFKPQLPAKPLPAMTAVKVIDSPRALPAFKLESATGPMTADQLKGHWTVVFVGFTHCPDVCPTTLTDMARAQALWDASGLPQKPKLLFLSIDPERDTPAKIAEYAAFFHKDTLTATAAEPQLGEFTRALGLVYMKVPQGDSYTMDHSATLVLLNPKAEFAGIIRPPLKPEAIGADLIALAKARP
ncbi:SCO family protein [Arenimonas sp. GDDSR-1]|uniref:SCO family protein n=1 Tax=Arenimonas sp. GDDSR-1 TaxID=2950125 RepID=UPI002623C3C4|nr:SCO family protein [Arenimonas sp. GDDSR-1]